MAAPTIRASTAMTPAEASGASIVFTKPGAMQDGDLIVLFVNGSAGSTGAVSATGFTVHPTSTTGYAMLTKVAASEGASWTVTVTGAANTNGVGCCITAGTFNATTPVNVTPSKNPQTGPATHVATGITTTVADCLMLAAFMSDNGAASQTLSGFSLVGTSNDWDWLFSATQAGAGASGDKTAGVQNTSSGDVMRAMLAAIAPVSGTLTQLHTRWYDDDADPSTSTAAANEDATLTRAAGTAAQLRTMIDASGQPADAKFKLQTKRTGDAATEWRTVT